MICAGCDQEFWIWTEFAFQPIFFVSINFVGFSLRFKDLVQCPILWWCGCTVNRNVFFKFWLHIIWLWSLSLLGKNIKLNWSANFALFSWKFSGLLNVTKHQNMAEISFFYNCWTIMCLVKSLYGGLKNNLLIKHSIKLSMSDMNFKFKKLTNINWSKFSNGGVLWNFKVKLKDIDQLPHLKKLMKSAVPNSMLSVLPAKFWWLEMFNWPEGQNFQLKIAKLAL